MRIEMSAYVLASIFIFFLVVASYVILPVLYSDEFIFSKLKKDFRLRMKFILAIVQVAMMLPILFFSEFEKVVAYVICGVLFLSLFIFCSLSSQERKDLLSFACSYFIVSFLLFGSALFVVNVFNINDIEWSFFILSYVSFLCLNNIVYLFYNDVNLLKVRFFLFF